jgi:endonuclease/exonuclease/phosphatase family metal-dependent hydrolase
MMQSLSEQSPTEAIALIAESNNGRASNDAANFITSSVLKIVSWLHDPIIYSSASFHRILAPWMEGRPDHCSTWSREFAARFLYGGSLLVSLPIGIVAGALALPFRGLASAVKNQDYCYTQGDAREKEFDNSFTFLTWNICCHEGGMSLSTGGMIPWKQRIDRIVQIIRAQNPDVLCLQEVQSVDIAEALFVRLKDLYPHCYFNLGIHPLKSSSGLIIFSKLDSSFEFRSFEDAADWAKQEKKGVASMVIANQVHLCFTHLQWGGESAIEIISAREKQILKIVDLMHSKKLPAILAGDLNLDRNGSTFNSSKLSKTFEMINNNIPTWTSYFIQKMWKGEAAPKNPDEQSIDYIAYYKGIDSPTVVLIETDKVEAYDTEDPYHACSDHHGLFGRVICK